MLDKIRIVKGALGRPLRVERRGLQFHLVLGDRRRTPRSVDPLSVTQMCAELRERLLVHEHDHAAEVMRHLVFVHDVLGRKGWDAIEALPARTIGKALVQAEMLVSQQGSQALTRLIERLRVLKVAADLRDERKAGSHDASDEKSMQVSESTHEDVEDIQRHWGGGLPA
ncbi:MAG: hypothetical protein Q7T97_00985 [Burkholderiaceae bacterium]|nr:hypothetical protein [Burkholderiaceae bacterium]